MFPNLNISKSKQISWIAERIPLCDSKVRRKQQVSISIHWDCECCIKVYYLSPASCAALH